MKVVHLVLATLILLFATITTAAAFGGQTWFLSQTGAGVAGNDSSSYPDTDRIGRYTVFESRASNLVPNDTNDEIDIFLKDRVTGEITLVSRGLNGVPANEDSNNAVISDNGRYVTFTSHATNLVSDVVATVPQAYVFDRETNTVELVSTNAIGEISNAGSGADDISADGRYVLINTAADNFGYADANGDNDIFLKDRQTGTVELISVATNAATGNLGSYTASMSADANYIVFASYASNLGPTDTTEQVDIYYRDRTTNATSLVSISEANQQSEAYVSYPSVTDDGRYVVFVAEGNGLIPVGLPGTDDNIVMRDMQTGGMHLVSGDGNAVAVNASGMPEIAADGRWVVFEAYDNPLVMTDTNTTTDIYLKDMETEAVQLVSVGPNGEAGNYPSGNAVLSHDGTVIVYDSYSSTFAPNDDIGMDVFAAVAFVEPSAVSLGGLSAASSAAEWGWLAGAAGLLAAALCCASAIKRRTTR